MRGLSNPWNRKFIFYLEFILATLVKSTIGTLYLSCIMKLLALLLVVLSINCFGSPQKTLFFVDIENKSGDKAIFRFKDSIDSLKPNNKTRFIVPLSSNSDLLGYLYIFIVDPKNNIKEQKQFRVLPDKVMARSVVVASNGQILFKSGTSETQILKYQNKLTKDNFWEITRKEIKLNFNNSVGAEIINLSLCESKYSIDTIRHYYNILSDFAKKTLSGAKVHSYLRGRESLKVGTLMEDFSLPNSMDKFIKLSDIKSEFVLIDFWFSTCIPCIESFPDLKEVYSSSSRSKFEVLGVSVDAQKRKEKWKSVIEKEKLTWINLLDSEFDISYKRFSIEIYPTTILLGKNRKIIKINPSAEELKILLKESQSN